jgi:hypothetical protein
MAARDIYTQKRGLMPRLIKVVMKQTRTESVAEEEERMGALVVFNYKFVERQLTMLKS